MFSFFTFCEAGLCQLIEEIKVKKPFSPCKPTKRDQVFSPLPKVTGIQLKKLIKVKDILSPFDEFMESKGPAAHPERGETGGQKESEIDPKTTPEMPPKMSPSGPPESAKNSAFPCVFAQNGAPKGPRF